MKWRLVERNGEAIYELSADDDGQLKGLTPFEFEKGLQPPRHMAAGKEAKDASDRGRRRCRGHRHRDPGRARAAAARGRDPAARGAGCNARARPDIHQRGL